VLTKLEAFFGWPDDSYQVVDYRQRIPCRQKSKTIGASLAAYMTIRRMPSTTYLLCHQVGLAWFD